MTNLSGEYDLVVEVSVEALNAIMAAVHANQDPGYPRMPHSLSLVVDDAHQGDDDPIPAAERTGIRTRAEVQVSTPTLSLPVDTLVVRPEVMTLARRVARPTDGGAEAPSVGPRIVRWPPPWIQPSAPSITATTRLRAWIRDTTDPPLPSFVDGDLVVTTTLARTDVPGVGMFVTLDRTNGPTVTFRPRAGTGVTPDQASVIAQAVRNVIRVGTEPSTFRVRVPPEVRHLDFELQPQARRPSALLTVTLGPNVPGPNALGRVAGGMLPDGADFAVGVGRDHVLGLLGSSLFQGLPGQFSSSKWGVSAKLRPNWAGASFDLEAGRIVFALDGDGDISWWGVNDHFTFHIRQGFRLVLGSEGIEVVRDGDPVVDLDDVAVGGGYLEAKAREKIREASDAALAARATELKDDLDVARHVESIIAGINPNPAGVALTGVDVRPDGVLVTGTIGLAVTAPVIAGQVGRGGFTDALESWIPGGTVERLVWERYPPPADTRVEEHRFVTDAITGKLRGGVCLRVEGTRVTPGGGVVALSGSACFPFAPVLHPVGVRDMATAMATPLLPLEEPGPDGTRLIGHYDPWATGQVPAEGQGTLLVHVGTDAREVEALLSEALTSRKGRGGVVAVGVVRPGGKGAGGRSQPGERPAGSEGILLVEDRDGSWAEATGAAEGGAVLIGPRGKIVWQAKEAATARQIANALDRHGKDVGEGGEGAELATQPIAFAVRPGLRPPDVPIRLPDGSELSLLRFKGRGLALAFYTSRSEPSIEHLDLLREVGNGGEEGPLVIAIGDGETWEDVAALVEARRLPFLVVADADRLVARSFGIWAWPVTVWIRPDQRIEAIDIGATGLSGTARTRA
jgi:hypothetical protein